MAQQVVSDNKSVQMVVENFSSSYKYYKSFRDDWLRYFKKYRSMLDVDTTLDYFKWRSKLFIPATGSAVDGLVTNLALTLIPNDGFFNVRPREPGDVERSRVMEKLLSYEFQESDFRSLFNTFLKQLAIYGTSPGKVFWKTIKRKQKRRRPVMAMDILGTEIDTGEFEIREEEDTIFDGPVFEPIDIFDFYISQKAKSLKDTWVIHRTNKKLGQIKELQKQGIYKNVGDLERLVSGENTQEDEYAKDKRRMIGLPDAWDDETGDNRTIEILEYWDQNREKIITIAGREVILRETTNPLGIDPFVLGGLWENPFQLYSSGVPEKCSDLQDQLNSEVNQRLDNRNLKQNMIIKVRRGANVNVRNILSKPGAVWLTDDMDAIDPITIPDVGTPNSFAEENLLKRDIEEITGVSQYAKAGGTDQGSRKTATEASLESRAGSKGFAYFVLQIEQQVLRPIIQKFYQLTELFMDEEKAVRILGEGSEEKYIKVSPSDVRGNYDFVPIASSQLINKDIMVQQMVQLLQMAAQDPSIDRRTIYKKIWEAWGYQNFDELFTQAPLMPVGMQEQMQAQQAKAQESMGMRPGSPQEGAAPVQVNSGIQV